MPLELVLSIVETLCFHSIGSSQFLDIVYDSDYSDRPLGVVSSGI